MSDLPAPRVVGCSFEDVFLPRLSSMRLEWSGPAAAAGQRTWALPGEITLRGAAPTEFGIYVQREGEDSYDVRLVWNQTHLSQKGLTRRQLRQTCLGPLLRAMGTDFEYLLDQPVCAPAKEVAPPQGVPHLRADRPHGRLAPVGPDVPAPGCGPGAPRPCDSFRHPSEANP